MAGNKHHKNDHQHVPANLQKTREHAPLVSTAGFDIIGFLSGFKVQAFVLAAIAFIFYSNTFSNEYALDDVMVIQKNAYVHEGLKGIPVIFSKDTYDGYYKEVHSVNELAGGRYRPLSIATFALEEELLGKEADENPALGESVSEHAARYMHTRHVVNVLLYMLSVVVFLYFLRMVIFKEQVFIAFLAALLFTIHPIHTEVVANIKSRDEILSFLFICLTLIGASRYVENKKPLPLAAALLCYALALFSKEYAMILVAIIPLMLYLFNGQSIARSIRAIIPYGVVLVIYVLIRFSVVSGKAPVVVTDVQNDPYLFATGLQRLTTEVATLLNYLKLLFFPYPLSADYSYAQIPYNDLSGIKFWISLSVHIGLVVACIRLFMQRHVLSFAIAFYLLNLLLVSNLVFNLGATMGERLIYHSSAGFAIAISWLLIKGFEKAGAAKALRPLLVVFAAGLVVVCGYEVTGRNTDWKDTNTLFAEDVDKVPQSFLANGIAGVGYCAMSQLPENKADRDSLLHKGVAYLNRSIAINKRYVNGYYNRALAYSSLGQWDLELADLDSVKRLKPDYPDLTEQYLFHYHDKTLACIKAKKYDDAIAASKEACRLAPKDPEMWYMLGISYYTVKDYTNAFAAWDAALKLNPGHAATKNAYAVAQKIMAQSAHK